MSSPSKETEEPTSTSSPEKNAASGSGDPGASAAQERPPAKRRLSSTVIEISDTESDDSDVCAVNSYQASADEVKRIRAEYSSSSSSSDYSSDSESPWEDDSILVEDKVHSKLVKSQLNPRAHRMDDPKFNPLLKSQEIKTKLTNHWSEAKDYSSDEVTLTCEPFRLCLLHDLLENPEIINNIVDDMNTLDWSRKKMDLYEFHQTTDLANLTWQRSIRGIYELLKTEVMSWVSEVTGLRLTSVSASCSLYGPGDHLLVHDDMLADRRIAFILYLAPTESKRGWCGWEERLGGALELLGRDEQGRAAAVQHRVYPRNNMLAFFRVGHDSFHQVSEVVSLELPRLSINGWFHGPEPPDPPALAPPPPALLAPPAPTLRPHSDVVLLNQWVDAPYMSPRIRAQVQSQMERASEVCLRDVLLPQRYQQLLHALARPEVEWEDVGPAQQRHYRRVSQQWAESEGGVIHELLHLMSSTTFLRMLADCTDLQLTKYSRLELQQWRPGDYTLLPASREAYSSARLEAVLYAGASRPLCGGHTSYVAPEDEAEGGEGGEGGEGALVTVPPQNNALSLVYCDAGAAAFTKYYARLAARPQDRFYILACTYTE
ncbi:unnamed protein product [Parnassius mnemosyne]|uniref:uS12 prolyl 3-hydroxylase n=1 Tax=Parnassius mnemosyne TaxID=213953 RepID=A0AAV1L0G9_9NEOP